MDKPVSDVVSDEGVVIPQPSWSNVILLQTLPTSDSGLAQGRGLILSVLAVKS